MTPCIPVRPATAAAGAFLLAALLTGCGSSSSDLSATGAMPLAQSPAAADSAAVAPAVGAPAAASAAAPSMNQLGASQDAKAAKATASHRLAAGAGGAPAAKLGVPDSALTGRSVVYNAEETVEVADVSRAVSSVEAAVDAGGGLVARSERTGDTANMRLRVPPSNFESFLDRIGKLGTVSDRTLSGDDVTDQVVDVASRVDTQRKSVDRVRALMSQATSLKDVVALEGELSQREADLESLLAKQNKLKNQTDLATVTVHLVTPAKAAVIAASEHRRGFTAGLGGGWDAFTAAAVGAATVLGAVLPFTVAIAVLAPPLAWATVRLRRSLTTRSTTVG